MTDQKDDQGHGRFEGGHFGKSGHSSHISGDDSESINYPFHYHYEQQKQQGDQPVIEVELPEFGFDVTQEGIEPDHSVSLFQAVGDMKGVECIFAKASLNMEGEVILGPVREEADEIVRLSFEDFLDFLIDHESQVILNVEAESDGENETIATILDELSRVWDNDCPQLIIASASPVLLSTVTEIIPTLPKALILDEVQAEHKFLDMEEVLSSLKVSALIVDDKHVSEETAETLINYELPIAVITGDSQLHAKRLQQWGFDSLISPYAHILSENL